MPPPTPLSPRFTPTESVYAVCAHTPVWIQYCCRCIHAETAIMQRPAVYFLPFDRRHHHHRWAVTSFELVLGYCFNSNSYRSLTPPLPPGNPRGRLSCARAPCSGSPVFLLGPSPAGPPVHSNNSRARRCPRGAPICSYTYTRTTAFLYEQIVFKWPPFVVGKNNFS